MNYYYNTARLFPCFPLDGLAVYMKNIHGFFFHIHRSRVSEASPVRLIRLAETSRDGKQYGIETGAASINKTTCLFAKQTNTHVLRTPCH